MVIDPRDFGESAITAAVRDIAAKQTVGMLAFERNRKARQRERASDVIHP
ncbi:hypothetical protein [Marinibacterium sp. SX1]